MKKILYIAIFFTFLNISTLFSMEIFCEEDRKPLIKPKTYLITLATSGIGQATAEELASQGHNLILLGRDSDKLSTLSDSLRANFGRPFPYFSSDYEKENFYPNFDSLSMQIDGLVIIPMRPQLPYNEIPTINEWEDVIRRSYLIPLEFIRRLHSRLNANGSIVVISGISSVDFVPQYANSNVIRLMWSGEIKNLASQLSSYGIRVNAVSPGLVSTQYTLNQLEKKGREQKKTLAQMIESTKATFPLGQIVTPQEVARAVHFLLSESAAAINGSNIRLDGGSSRSY